VADLREMYAAEGITPDKTVVTYCQTHHRAAHTYFVLRLLGIRAFVAYMARGLMGQPPRPADRALSRPLSPEAGRITLLSYGSDNYRPLTKQLATWLAATAERTGLSQAVSFVISWKSQGRRARGGPSCDWQDRSVGRAISSSRKGFFALVKASLTRASRGIRERSDRITNGSAGGRADYAPR